MNTKTEKLIDVLLDMKKKLHLTYQQLADIWQVNLSTAKSKLRGESRISIRDMVLLIRSYGQGSLLSIEPDGHIYIYINGGETEYETLFKMNLI